MGPGWTETAPLPAREQSLVTEGLEAAGQHLPAPVRGIDSHNDSAFINDALLAWRQQRQLTFARSRKDKPRAERERLDPLELPHPIRQAQAVPATLASGELGDGPGRESLEQFLAKLPEMWRDGEVRPAHRREAPQPRTWRTREGPFEGVWLELLPRLQAEPEAAAQSLLKRLQQKHPGRFPEGQVRTLQRRLREWRRVMARQLAHSCLGGTTAGAGTVVIGRNGSAHLAERSDAGAGAAPGGDGQRASELERGTEAAAQGQTSSYEQMSEAGAYATSTEPEQATRAASPARQAAIGAAKSEARVPLARPGGESREPGDRTRGLALRRSRAAGNPADHGLPLGNIPG